jgi:hypothetical protein
MARHQEGQLCRSQLRTRFSARTALRNREILPDVRVRPAARPIYHHKRESIEAHLSIVFAALGVSRWIEARRKFVRTACRYRTIRIQAGARAISAADPPP